MKEDKKFRKIFEDKETINSNLNKIESPSEKIKKYLNSVSNPKTLLTSAEMIGLSYENLKIKMKRFYKLNPKNQNILSARAENLYQKYNAHYQDALNKAQSFGADTSEYPKSLEKLTFSENN